MVKFKIHNLLIELNKNVFYMTALSVAIENGFSDIVELISSKTSSKCNYTIL